MPIQKTNRRLKQYQADTGGLTGTKFLDLVDSFRNQPILSPVAQVSVNLQYGDARLTGDTPEVRGLLSQVDDDDAPHNFNCSFVTNTNPRRTLSLQVAPGQKLVTFQGQGLSKDEAAPLLKLVEEAIPEVSGNSSIEAPTAPEKDEVEYLPGAFRPVAIPQTSDRDVFVIMSFSREHRDAYYLAIEPTLRANGFNAIRVDEVQHNTTVTVEIIRQIEKSVFVVADLTGERPNVYYEVGYAHRADKEVILMAQKDTAVHFDVAAINRIDYEDYTELREALNKRIVSISERLGLPEDLSEPE